MPKGHVRGSTCSRLVCPHAFRDKLGDSEPWLRSWRGAVRHHPAPVLCRTRGWVSGSQCAPGR